MGILGSHYGKSRKDQVKQIFFKFHDQDLFQDFMIVPIRRAAPGGEFFLPWLWRLTL